MKQFVIVVAGGKGLRMGSEIPKQFLEINGKAIILHTLEKFKKALPLVELFLVLPEAEVKRWEDLSAGTVFEKITIAIGGSTRFESVKAGLNLINESGTVGIHDAVRPFVSVETIKNAFQEAEKTGAAIPVVKLKDSLRKINDTASTAVQRVDYRIVQTPQCFDLNLIKKAYKQEFSEKFTDDATVLESDGIIVNLVQGNYSNIKITTQEDLKIGAILINE